MATDAAVGIYKITYTIRLEFIVKGMLTRVEGVFIKDIVCHCDYSNSFTNLYTIKFVTDLSNAHRILKSPESLLAVLKINKWKLTGMAGQEHRELLEKMEGTYIPIIEKGNGRERLPSLSRIAVSKDAALANTQYETVIHLNHIDNVVARKLRFNTVLKEVKILDALRYIANQSGLKSVIDVPDDSTVHPQILLLPGRLRESLALIQRFYPCYMTGLMSFIFDTTLYILKKGKGDHEQIKDDKYGVIGLNISTTSDDGAADASRQAELIVTKEGKMYQAKAIFTPVVSEILNSEIEGNGFIISDYHRSLNCLEVDDDSKPKEFTNPWLFYPLPEYGHDKSGKYTNIMYDEYNNPMNASAQLKVASQKGIINLVLGGVDIKDFLPNKSFKIKFLDPDKETDFGGMYRPVTARFGTSMALGRYGRETDPDFVFAANLILKRYDNEEA